MGVPPKVCGQLLAPFSAQIVKLVSCGVNGIMFPVRWCFASLEGSSAEGLAPKAKGDCWCNWLLGGQSKAPHNATVEKLSSH